MAHQNLSYIQVITDDVNGPEKCGYCKKEGTHFLEAGIWTFNFTPQNEQYLLERSWRRCGKFIYRLDKDKNCCPLYMIRCDAKNFKPSQSQKKVLRKMTNYLKGETNPEKNIVKPKEKAKITKDKIAPTSGASKMVVEKAEKPQEEGATPLKKAPPTKGVGADPNKARCLKAKVIRKQKKDEKLVSKNVEGASPIPKPKSEAKTDENAPKSLEAYLEEHKYQKGDKHKLETRLIQVNPESPEYKATEADSYQMWDRYQQKIHNDEPGKNNLEHYKNFLVTSAVAPQQSSIKGVKHGCFHLQYFIDDKLFMVGVLDLLPNYVSSVYTYYDPEFMFLSPGVYSALAEIGFTRELQTKYEPKLWYCLGYYAYTIQKMKYKGEYFPSELNCPYTHNWISFDKCLPQLKTGVYKILDESSSKPLPVDSYIKKCLIFCGGRQFEYDKLISKNEDAKKNDAKIRKYCEVVGPEFCQKAAAIFDFL